MFLKNTAVIAGFGMMVTKLREDRFMFKILSNMPEKFLVLLPLNAFDPLEDRLIMDCSDKSKNTTTLADTKIVR